MDGAVRGGGGAGAEAGGCGSVDANLDDIIRPERREQFEKMARTCISTPRAFLTIGGLLKPSEYLSVDVVATEPWRPPHGRVSAALLITHGTADTLNSFDLSVQDVARRCAEGEEIQLVRLPGVAHDAREESAVLVLGWVQDRYAGRPTGWTCGP